MCIILIINCICRVKKIDDRYALAKARKAARRRCGYVDMSRLIEKLIGKECYISVERQFNRQKCTLIDIDGECLEIKCINRKNIASTRILKIENIEYVELSE